MARKRFNPIAQRGYVIHYREGESNFCPGCGRSHWYIGRQTAECAWCYTAIPLSGKPVQVAA